MENKRTVGSAHILAPGNIEMMSFSNSIILVLLLFTINLLLIFTPQSEAPERKKKHFRVFLLLKKAQLLLIFD